MDGEETAHFIRIPCEQCGKCCQNYYVLVTFTDFRIILRHYPSLSLKNIAQLVEFSGNYPEQSILHQYPPIKIWDKKQNREQTGYLTLQWQTWPSEKITCLFYDPDPGFCKIHGSHPKICQCYPFHMENMLVRDRETRRCPHFYSLPDVEYVKFWELWRQTEQEKTDYWTEIVRWHARPPKSRTWRDLALFLIR